MIRLSPMRFVRDVPASIRFYTALGFEVDVVGRVGGWAELRVPSAQLGLHVAGEVAPHVDDRGRACCVLNVDTDEPLEEVRERMRAAGYAADDILDENFGRIFYLRDPDGMLVGVTEPDRELYT